MAKKNGIFHALNSRDDGGRSLRLTQTVSCVGGPHSNGELVCGEMKLKWGRRGATRTTNERSRSSSCRSELLVFDTQFPYPRTVVRFLLIHSLLFTLLTHIFTLRVFPTSRTIGLDCDLVIGGSNFATFPSNKPWRSSTSGHYFAV